PTGGAAFLFPYPPRGKHAFRRIGWRGLRHPLSMAGSRARTTGARLRPAMKLSQLLVPELVIHPLQVRDKWAAIEAMTRAAVAAGRLPGTLFDDVHRALVLREKSMTTGMEHGVAIPHAAVDRLDDVVAVFAIAPDGVPFESLDGQPARILVGLI